MRALMKERGALLPPSTAVTLGGDSSHLGARLPLSAERIHLPGLAAPRLLGDPVEEGPRTG